MQGLTRWNPFREMTAQKDMDDLFSRFFGRGERLMPVLSFGSYPPVDVVRKGDNLLVNVDLPGIDPKDIDISVTGNVLTIRGKR
ncbi:MAG: Hsp20/alpha crystallin family protein, partial [Nitrospirota bacterium]